MIQCHIDIYHLSGFSPCNYQRCKIKTKGITTIPNLSRVFTYANANMFHNTNFSIVMPYSILTELYISLNVIDGKLLFDASIYHKLIDKLMYTIYTFSTYSSSPSLHDELKGIDKTWPSLPCCFHI